MSLRICLALAKLDESADTILVVGHGNSGQALAIEWLGLPLADKVAFQFDTASISEFRINKWGERMIVHVNSRFDA